MSLLFILILILIMGKFYHTTVNYIMMDATKELDEKYKLIKIAYTIYITTLVATGCYLSSLAYIYKGG